ncbi:MAG: ASCH domain-containing protein [bacterium]|nr:ASCH domain-containing protein [bacterium]
MEHLAIMKKSWELTDKILNKQKKIESRWYSVKYKPWDSIKEGETIYFKDSGEPVRIKAEVSKVIQFADLTPSRVKEILDEYGKDDGIEKVKIPEFFERFKNKKYCMLIFLKNPRAIKSFEIDKTGFGAMSAWIEVNNINRIKRYGK